MPDDQNITQNQDSVENSIPASPQEPTEPAPINTTDSEPAEALPDALEPPGDGFPAKSTDIPPSNSTLTEAENEQKTEEKQAKNEPSIESNPEPVAEPIQTPESLKAQTSTNEPLTETDIKPVEVEISEPQPPRQTEATPPSVPVPVSVLSQPSHKNMSELRAKEHLAIQNKKRKRLNSIMSLFLKNSKITNDEVEKFLHVSDATATRYLTQLEKEGKIKKNEKKGKLGKWVSYFKL